MPLTDIACKNASPREKPYKLSHEGGLYLLVLPNGGKYWRYKYRFNGKERLLAIGVYPDKSLKAAAKARGDAADLLEAGHDPSTHKQVLRRERLLRAENTFESVAREWHEAKAADWSVRHGVKIMGALEADIFPEIGQRPIAEIKARELLACLRKVEHRGALDVAGRQLQRIGSVFRYAIATGRAEDNPAAHLKGALKTPERRNFRSLTAAEMPDFLRALARYEGTKTTQLALRLIVLTFVRTVELRGAEWSEIDFEADEWRVPAERMKMREQHIVPLSTQAIACLRKLRDLTGERAHLFPNAFNPAKFMSENTMLKALDLMGYRDRTTVHGFRSTASTTLHEMGFDSDVIERQLAHAEGNKVKAAYNHARHLEKRRELMQAWADLLDSWESGAKVVAGKFRRGTRVSGQAK